MEQVESDIEVGQAVPVGKFCLDTKSHRVSLVEEVGPMVGMGQVASEDQVEPAKQQRVDLVVQNLGLVERKAGAVAQKVVLVVDIFSPEEHKMLPIEHKVDQQDRRVVLVGPKVVPERVVLVDHRVVLVGM